jgi:serine/threonine-protein kinase
VSPSALALRALAAGERLSERYQSVHKCAVVLSVVSSRAAIHTNDTSWHRKPGAISMPDPSHKTPVPPEVQHGGQAPKPSGEEDLTGRQLGDYRLLRRLGHGGMAEVYLAEQLSLKRQIALKVLRADLAENEDYVRRFHNEAQAAAALVHANIVQIHEVGQVEGVHFIAQEYVQGKNLREYLDRHGPMDVRLTVLVVRQVAAALLRAAQHGIVHRDIKPENVLLTAAGEAKVADFGLAHVLREGEQVNLTQIGVTMGTPLYMSPEQAEGKPLDHRSDLYSLGVTMYHMLAGQPPFRGESALAVAVQHLKSQPEPLATQRPDVPEAICRIVHRLLEKAPANRYASARDLLRDLRLAAADGLGDVGGDDELWQTLGAELSGPIEATRMLEEVMKTAALMRRRRAHTGLWLAGGVALAFVLGAACVWAMRPSSLLPASAAAHLEIPRQASAEAQYVYAGLFNSKAHWQSVIDYKPHDEFFALLAKKELAFHYLQDGDRQEASAILYELAALPEFENELRTFGIAGLAVLDSLEGRHSEAMARARLVWPLVRHLDRRMAEALGHAVQLSDPASSGAWEAWVNEAFYGQEEPAGDGKEGKSALPPKSSPGKPSPTKPTSVPRSKANRT